MHTRPDLFSYIRSLLLRGRMGFAREEAMQALGIDRGPFWDAAERLQRRGELFRVRRGFYVIVPAHMTAFKAPPACWYIDELMRYENALYYVGLGAAASRHGFRDPTAPSELHVICNRRLPPILAGLAPTRFYFRKDMSPFAPFLEERRSFTARFRISSVELTALDLLRYCNTPGNLRYIVEILSQLAAKIDGGRLAAVSDGFEMPVGQRLGYLLERLGHGERVVQLYERLTRRAGKLAWSALGPPGGVTEQVHSPVHCDSRWRVRAVADHAPSRAA